MTEARTPPEGLGSRREPAEESTGALGHGRVRLRNPNGEEERVKADALSVLAPTECDDGAGVRRERERQQGRRE